MTNNQKQELTIQQLMEGYIMPNDFNTDLLEPQELSRDEQQRILQQTLRNTAPNTQPRRGLPRRRLLVFSLAAVMLLVMSSLAVAEFALKQDFFGFFNAGDGELPMQSGQEINMQASNENGTLTVEQVLGDNQTVYVLLDFAAPEGTVLDRETYQWDKAWVSPSGSKGCGYYFEVLPDDDPADNRIRMMLCLNADNSLKGQQLDLTLGDLKGYSPEDREYTDFVYGEWKLNFKLDYEVVSTVLAQDLDLQFGEAVAHMNSLEISPFTMILDFDLRNVDGYVAPEWYEEPEGGGVEMLPDGTERYFDYADNPPAVKLNDLLTNLDYFSVWLKNDTATANTDGAVGAERYTRLDTMGGGANGDETHYQVIFEFNHVLNLDEIASIKYFDQELKLQ